ncbi:hypothetical protein ACFVFH_19440 [Streptomyces sp. NPDC057697]|uniref:hypothetical protein n=1 Tax=Streptomyces sp. NPDC057697 TaxID=3346219 RepID=UPI0036D177D2
MTLNEWARITALRWGAVPMGLAGAILLTSCASHESSPDVASEVKAPVLLKSVDLRLPLETYLFSESEQLRMDEARAALNTTCMRRFGLSYDPGSPGPPLGPRSLMDRRYGVTDEAEARSFGYHLGDRDPRTHPSPTPKPLTATQSKVLLGTSPDGSGSADNGNAPLLNGLRIPAEGCMGESMKKLADGGRIGPTDQVRNANAQSFKTTMADARVVKVFEAWSQCMKKQGYAYPDPFAAMSDPRFQGTKAVPDERKVAVADVACKKKTNLIGTWFTVETSEQKKLIAENRSAFASASKGKKEQLAKAAEALKSAR